jgi:hypothetical protein
MDTSKIVSEIDAEIARLQQARDLLAGSQTVVKRKPGRPALDRSSNKATSFDPKQFTGKPKAPARTLSPEARARIAAGQKRRWAQARKKTAPSTEK